MLLDIPEDEVLFGFDEYAAALTASIMGTQPHFTVGIFGSWGRRKTTLLRKIKSQIESKYSNKAHTVFFEGTRGYH